MSAKLSGRLPSPTQAASSQSIAAGWKTRLLIGRRGAIQAGVANAIIALRHAPEWQGVLHFNLSSLAVVAKLTPPFVGALAVPFTWDDEHDVLTAAWLQHHNILVNKEIAGQAVHAVARQHSFHPIRDYLNSLKWDNVKRIDNWLTRYLGADQSEYTRAVSAKFLISAVARAFKPGCKVDTCLILEGTQGAQKSTAIRTLAGKAFFSDDISQLGSKDSVMQTRGIWIIELAELDAMTGSKQSCIKAFMSRQVDRIRPPYGRRVVEAQRECVFVGTVNKETYLSDETGGRRYWPVKCRAIRITDLERDRDQLWAEAFVRYSAGENWWFDNPALTQSAAQEVAARYEPDPWDDLIASWVKKPMARVYPPGLPPLTSTSDFVIIKDILIHCIGKDPNVWKQEDQNRVAHSLTAMGSTRRQKRVGGVRIWAYAKPAASPVPPV
jgi:predicted P-loop ATPase